jgi:hypothetical protein
VKKFFVNILRGGEFEYRNSFFLNFEFVVLGKEGSYVNGRSSLGESSDISTCTD